MEQLGRKYSRNITLFISTFFMTGLISKRCPGTIGSIFASILCIVLYLTKYDIPYHILSIFLFILGIISSHIYIFVCEAEKNRDPGYIVIDEACGIFLGCAILKYCGKLSIISMILNLIFFRIFDIIKPFPIRYIDNYFKKYKMTASFGIMIDDIVASIIATLLELYTLYWIYNHVL